MTAETNIIYERKPPQCVDECPFSDADASRAGVEFARD